LDDAASAFYIFTYRNFGIICFPTLTPLQLNPAAAIMMPQSNKKLLLCKGANFHPSYFGVFYTNSFIKLSKLCLPVLYNNGEKRGRL